LADLERRITLDDYERAAQIVTENPSLGFEPEWYRSAADEHRGPRPVCTGGPDCLTDVEVRSVLRRAGE
jgi:hypothetical protein